MANKSYKVIDPHGITGFNGRKYAKDAVVENEPDAHIKAWLRFGQVKEIAPKAAAPKGAGAPEGKSGEADK